MVGHQVGDQLVDCRVEGSLKSERNSHRRRHLGYDPVYIGVVRALAAQLPGGDVVEGLVVERDGEVLIVEQTTDRQGSVVGLDDRVAVVSRRKDCQPYL